MTARRALVTGGAGFVGQWLLRALLARGYEPVSVSQSAEPAAPILRPDEHQAVRWHADDLRAPTALGPLLHAHRPELVFHLAGVSYVPEAQDAPLHAYEVNTMGFARLAEQLKALHAAGVADPSTVVVGSGEQYGRHPADELPLRETAEQRPLTVYAASKVAQEAIALQTARSSGLRIVATRSFNHSGAGHSPRFLLPALVGRVKSLRRSGATRLALGNSEVVRDFLHVADVAEAYCRLAERGVPGEAYNVASGVGTSVRTVAEHVLQRLGATAEIATDPALLRPVDVPALVGSPAKLQAATGWRPERTLDDIIDDLIEAGSDHAAT